MMFGSKNEVLYGAKEEYLKACRKYGADCETDSGVWRAGGPLDESGR